MFGGKWSRCFNVVHTVTPTNNILNFIGQHRERLLRLQIHIMRNAEECCFSFRVAE